VASQGDVTSVCQGAEIAAELDRVVAAPERDEAVGS
jgi:hypothetical protein